MGYKLERKELIKTLKGILDLLGIEPLSTSFSRISQPLIQNDMVSNLPTRINGKLTEQVEKIVKIEERLQKLDKSVLKEKEVEIPTNQTRVGSASSEKTVIEQIATHAFYPEGETDKASVMMNL